MERINDQWMSSDYHTPIFKRIRHAGEKPTTTELEEFDPRKDPPTSS
jgi:hypothetical protein